jgi:glycosyltransferase involved in cell wall biosynthesis/predicted O-methyltransferase YrrM
MKILWNSNAPWLQQAGYGKQTALWVPRLAGHGHEVTVSAPYSSFGAVFTWQGFTVLPGGLDAFGSDVINGHYKHCNADLMITLCDVFAMDAARLKPLNVAHWIPVDCKPLGVTDRKKLELSGGLPIAFSRFGEQMLRNAGFDPLYVPHGIDTTLFRPSADRDLLRESVGVGANTFLVGINAWNKESGNRKAWPEQLQAFAEFHRRHENTALVAHTSVNTRPVGGFNLRSITDDLGISEAVMFPDQHDYISGMVTDDLMAEWYQTLDVYLGCTKAEGFGLPVMEAQASGVPVIVTDCSALTEICGSGWKVRGQRERTLGHDAWWVTPSVDGIVDALEEAYAEWPANDTRRAQAREFALRYDVETVFGQYWKPVLADLEARLAKGGGRFPVSLQADYQQRLAVWSDVQEEMPILHNAVLGYSAPRILELGVRTGNSTSAFLAAAEKAGGHLWSVDIEKPRVPDSWFQSPVWTFTQGDDMAPDVVKAQPDVVDILFLDVDPHSYRQTLDELYQYVPLVRPGGIVFAHDTKLDPGMSYPVAQAMDEFCRTTGFTWREQGGQYGLGRIDVPVGN